MAIAFDAANDGSFTTATSLTWSHTCTGSHLALLVGVWCSGNNASSVTYNGVALSQLAHVAGGSGGSAQDFYLYGMLNPATGSHSVVFNVSSSVLLGGGSASWTGVTSLGSNTTAVNASTSSFSMALTPNTDNCWVVGVSRNDSGTASAGASTTVRVSGAASALTLSDNNAAIHPAASTTLIVTTGGATAWSGAIIALQANVTGGMFLVF